MTGNSRRQFLKAGATGALAAVSASALRVGSPTSKENDDRLEAKIDELIRLQAGDRADGLLRDIDERYLRSGGHADPFGHHHKKTKR